MPDRRSFTSGCDRRATPGFGQRDREGVRRVRDEVWCRRVPVRLPVCGQLVGLLGADGVLDGVMDGENLG